MCFAKVIIINNQLKYCINMQPIDRTDSVNDVFKLISNTCYTIQLMHYLHFKTHSLQHLKPIKR